MKKGLLEILKWYDTEQLDFYFQNRIHMFYRLETTGDDKINLVPNQFRHVE